MALCRFKWVKFIAPGFFQSILSKNRLAILIDFFLFPIDGKNPQYAAFKGFPVKLRSHSMPHRIVILVLWNIVVPQFLG